MQNKAEEAFEVILKRNPGIVKKDPDSPKTHSLLLVSLFAEVMNYRAKNALLLSLLFNAIVSLAKSQPEKSGKRAADITKTLRLEVASQVLRTGMLSKALDKFLAEQFEKSGSKVLPYVG